MTKTKKKNFTYARGKRKESSARVRLVKGKGEIVVNDKAFDQYFPGIRGKLLLERLFKELGVEGKYFATVRVSGGGKIFLKAHIDG